MAKLPNQNPEKFEKPKISPEEEQRRQAEIASKTKRSHLQTEVGLGQIGPSPTELAKEAGIDASNEALAKTAEQDQATIDSLLAISDKLNQGTLTQEDIESAQDKYSA